MIDTPLRRHPPAHLALGNAGAHSGNGALLETYVRGPETDADPATYRTELYLPLVEG